MSKQMQSARLTEGTEKSVLFEAKDLRDHLHRRLSALRSERLSYFNHWRELSAYILPRRGRFLGEHTDRGGIRSDKILDNTATIAARTLASGMMAGITSPARQWFRLATDDPKLMKRGDVTEWLAEVETIMRDTFARSNTYACLQNLYEELAVFGTGAMIIQADAAHVVRCRTLTAGEYLIAQNDRQVVDTLYREFSMTVAQMAMAFGAENFTDATRSLWDAQQLDTWVELIHAIEPNPWARPGSEDARHMPYRSVYMEKAATDTFLRISGFEQFPVVAPRWSITGADVYGRGPGMDALPDVKQLQHEQLRKAQGIDKMVNPPMVAPAHLKGQAATVLPGGVTYVDVQQGQTSFQPAYRVEPRLNELTLDIKETQQRINRALYADLFLMLNEMDRTQMTAREVDERREEKLLMLGPVLERLHSELLTPLVDRTFQLLLKAERLPAPPAELMEQSLHVTYLSMLDRAQQAQSLGGVERLLTFMGMLAPSAPDIMNVLDAEKIIRAYAEQLDVPSNLLRSPDEMAALKAEAEQEIALAAERAIPESGAQDIGAQAFDASAGLDQATQDSVQQVRQMVQQAGYDPDQLAQQAQAAGIDVAGLMVQLQSGTLSMEELMAQIEPFMSAPMMQQQMNGGFNGI